MVSFVDASPDRMTAPSARLDLAQIGNLSFEAPDIKRFPAISLAREALKSGGAAPTILNAANEVAVHGFLEGKIGFLDIPRVVETTLERAGSTTLESLDHVYAADSDARDIAQSMIAGARR